MVACAPIQADRLSRGLVASARDAGWHLDDVAEAGCLEHSGGAPRSRPRLAPQDDLRVFAESTLEHRDELWICHPFERNGNVDGSLGMARGKLRFGSNVHVHVAVCEESLYLVGGRRLAHAHRLSFASPSSKALAFCVI